MWLFVRCVKSWGVTVFKKLLTSLAPQSYSVKLCFAHSAGHTATRRLARLGWLRGKEPAPDSPPSLREAVPERCASRKVAMETKTSTFYTRGQTLRALTAPRVCLPVPRQPEKDREAKSSISSARSSVLVVIIKHRYGAIWKSLQIT